MQDFESKKNYKVKPFDAFFATIISVAILIFISYYDISQHDTFILSSYDCDDPSSVNYDSQYCKNIRHAISLHLPYTGYEFEVGQRDTYWVFMNGIVLAFGIFGLVVRAAMGSVMAGFMWFMTIVLPVFAGFEDIGYYEFTGREMPNQMAWLNNNLFIGFWNSVFFGDAIVTITSLYLSMAVCIAILLALWVVSLREQVLEVVQR